MVPPRIRPILLRRNMGDYIVNDVDNVVPGFENIDYALYLPLGCVNFKSSGTAVCIWARHFRARLYLYGYSDFSLSGMSKKV